MAWAEIIIPLLIPLAVIMIIIYLKTQRLFSLAFSLSGLTFVTGILFTIDKFELSDDSIFLLLIFSALFMVGIGFAVGTKLKKHLKKHHYVLVKRCIVALSVALVLLIAYSALFMPKPAPENSKYGLYGEQPYEARPYPPRHIEEGSVNTCGNGACEAYELLNNCEQDCLENDQHTYTVCLHDSFEDVYRVRVLGTDTYIDKENGCYTVNEVQEPILEFQLISFNKNRVPVCKDMITSYHIDGEDIGCSDSQWEIQYGNIYFPYTRERFDHYSRVAIS